MSGLLVFEEVLKKQFIFDALSSLHHRRHQDGPHTV
jgi:hypothetical protein